MVEKKHLIWSSEFMINVLHFSQVKSYKYRRYYIFTVIKPIWNWMPDKARNNYFSVGWSMFSYIGFSVWHEAEKPLLFLWQAAEPDIGKNREPDTDRQQRTRLIYMQSGQCLCSFASQSACRNTVKCQWLEHWWLIYHAWLELFWLEP